MEAGLQQVTLFNLKDSYVISITRFEAGRLQRTLLFPYSSQMIAFASVWNLIMQIEADMISIYFPQNTFEIWKWSKKAGTSKKIKIKNQSSTQAVHTSYVPFRYRYDIFKIFYGKP